MTLKNKIQLVVVLTALGFASIAAAGKQGISFYGGLGLTAISPNSVSGLEFDPAAGGNLFLGIEEDGWFLESVGIATLKAGTNVTNEEYVVTGSVNSLGYRTLETRSGLYFLLSAGVASMDVTYSQAGFADVIRKNSGNAVTLGIGLRMDRTERLELDYSLMRLSDDSVANSSGNVHMVNIRYIWGGNPYDPRF